MKTTIAMIASTGGPMRITNRISARVRAEYLRNNGRNRRPKPAASIVALALMVSSRARTSVMPRNVYI